MPQAKKVRAAPGRAARTQGDGRAVPYGGVLTGCEESTTIRHRMATSTRSRADWLRAARLALRRRGPDAVRVEPLARALGVTKGSFYWHFRDRSDLLEALLKEWEDETGLLTE